MDARFNGGSQDLYFISFQACTFLGTATRVRAPPMSSPTTKPRSTFLPSRPPSPLPCFSTSSLIFSISFLTYLPSLPPFLPSPQSPLLAPLRGPAHRPHDGHFPPHHPRLENSKEWEGELPTGKTATVAWSEVEAM